MFLININKAVNDSLVWTKSFPDVNLMRLDPQMLLVSDQLFCSGKFSYLIAVQMDLKMVIWLSKSNACDFLHLQLRLFFSYETWTKKSLM